MKGLWKKAICRLIKHYNLAYDLHLQLLRSPKFPYYNSAYYKVLPYIVELRAKGADKRSLSWKRVLRRFMVSYC